jgi:hypothetical protein
MSEAPDERPLRSAAERAEEIVDHLAPMVGRLAALAGLQILKLAARAREEAEDIWAEAQSLRRQKDRRSG